MNNIRKTKELVRYDDAEFDYMITKYFQLENDIIVENEFTPLPILRGTLKGKGYIARKITFEKLATGSAFNGSGLFMTIWDGTVQFIKVEILSEVNRSGTYGIRKGAICGYLISGAIRVCLAYGSFENLSYNTANSLIGGICGDSLSGTIKNCSNYMTIKTYGTAGQIVGNLGEGVEIVSCFEYGTVTLK